MSAAQTPNSPGADQPRRNAELQKDEIEALKSIYGDDFAEDPFVPNSFSIVIHIGEKESEEATLMITFVKDYPSSGLPMYSLSIPWLRGEEKKEIFKVLEQIYSDSNREVIVYSWVEKLRELLSKPDLSPNSKASGPVDKSKSQPDDIENANDDIDISSAGEVALPQIITGGPLTDRKSTFQAHIAHVESVQQVRLVLAELMKNKKIASATHNMYAYRIQSSNSSTVSPWPPDKVSWIQDNDDDGETHAGERLMHLLQILDCRNVLVVVTRWFGGILLYGDRFKHINNVARTMLDQHGYIRSK